jgi:hypothetical protein
MNRLRLEMRFASGGLHKPGCVRQIEIDQLSAIVADGVVVPVGFTIVATGAVSKTDLEDESGLFQVAQRVVDSCVADAGETPAGGLKNVTRRRVVITFLNHLIDRFPLGRELRLFLCVLHSGFRLILNSRKVKPRINADKIHDFIDVGFEGWAVDAVRREELLGLARVVKLLHEEIGDGVMW